MGEPFQFDYVGYLRNMVFLIVLMGILAFILVKLKGGKARIPGLPLLKLPRIGNDSNQQIQIVERTLLEGRKNLYLVQVFENQYWLIGTTDTQITNLGQVKPPYEMGDGAEPEKPKAFAEYVEDHETKTTD